MSLSSRKVARDEDTEAEGKREGEGASSHRMRSSSSLREVASSRCTHSSSSLREVVSSRCTRSLLLLREVAR